MKEIIKSVVRLFAGLFLYAVGIVLTINANLGLAPWDVFHQGLSKITGITMGQASIQIGLIIVVLNFALGERVGWGTIFNMYFIGHFLDILMINQVIPVFDNVILQLIMLILGMFTVALATFCYIGAGFGSGPRDGLMVALTKRTNKSVRFIRNSIEISVLAIGYLMGGFIGIGTLITAIAVGYFVQLVFKIFKFDVKSVKHRFIDEDILYLKGLLFKKKKEADIDIE